MFKSLAVRMYPILCELDVKKLGQRGNHRWIPVLNVGRESGMEKSKGIPFFHPSQALVSSQLLVEGGKAAWQNGMLILKHLHCSQSLVCAHPLLVMRNKTFIPMFDRSGQTTCIDAVRFDMFARKQRSYGTTPPTLATLV